MKALIIDGHNFTFRSRSGFQLGDYNICYNFFRSLKPLIDTFEPNRVYFTLEGHPWKRYQLLPTYKANRHIIVPSDAPAEVLAEAAKKKKSDEDYRRQHNVIVDALSKHFPVSVLRHPNYEADDLIYNVIQNSSRAIDFTVVSTDTDFIQLLQQFNNVKVYNPVAKSLVEAPAYDYVLWKALKGDGSDNVIGLTGIGDVRAAEMASDPNALKEFLDQNSTVMEQVSRNLQLIEFMKWDEEETKLMESSQPTKDWDAVASLFTEWQFKSMLKEPYWTNFKATFDRLWGEGQ